MELDYSEIGKRIAQRRKKMGLTQTKTEERADIGYKYLSNYLSNIERGISIPSTEVVMRLAIALETTSGEFLVGTARQEEWKAVAELLRGMNHMLKMARIFLNWLGEQERF